MVELTIVSVPPTWAMPPPPAPALLPEKVELMIVFEKCRVVKTYLRKDKARTQQVLEKVIADALETIKGLYRSLDARRACLLAR